MISRIFPSLANVLSQGNQANGLNLEVNSAQAWSAHQATLTPSGTSQTIDWDEGNSVSVDLGSATGDVTLTLNNGQPGGSYIIEVIQASTARNLIHNINRRRRKRYHQLVFQWNKLFCSLKPRF